MANRFWVGGTASWNATAGTKWSLTSGGVGGENVPTAADDVFFDAASGAVTVTLNAQGSCDNIDFSGFTGTFAGASQIFVSGSWTWGAGMTRTYAGTINFISTAAETIASNGKSFGSSILLNGTGGSWQLQDTFLSTSAMTLRTGTFDTNNQTLQCTTFLWNSGFVRALILGNSLWTLTGSGANLWQPGSAINATLTTGGSSRLKFTGVNAPSNFNGVTGVLTYDDIEFAGGTSSFTMSTGVTDCRDILVTNPSASSSFAMTVIQKPRNLDFTGFGGTWGAGGGLTLTGDLTLNAGMSSSYAGNTITLGAGLQTVTSFGKQLGSFNFQGASVKIAGNLLCVGGIILTAGDVDMSGITVTATRFNGSGTLVRSFDLTNTTFNLTGSAAGTSDSWVMTTVTNLTATLTGSILNITNTTATDKAFAGGGLSYNEVHMNGGGSGLCAIQQNNTFNELNVNDWDTLRLGTNSVQTITGEFSMSGSPGNLMAIINEVPGTKGTIVVAKNYVRCDFLDLTDCVATGGARFFAGKNSVNSGGNNGWRFTDAAPRPPAVIRFSVQG